MRKAYHGKTGANGERLKITTVRHSLSCFAKAEWGGAAQGRKGSQQGRVKPKKGSAYKAGVVTPHGMYPVGESSRACGLGQGAALEPHWGSIHYCPRFDSPKKITPPFGGVGTR